MNETGTDAPELGLQVSFKELDVGVENQTPTAEQSL